jgi:xylan 1,4-beta-xylosidase
LTRESQLPLEGVKSSQGIFAPTLRHHEGTFYLVTTNMPDGRSFFVTTRDVTSEWSEPVWLDEAGFTMDPSLLFDDGRVYYTRHGGGERGGAYQAEIDIHTGKLRGPARQLWAGTGGVWPEGPHLYKIDGTYYLLISEGGTSTNHMLTIARSASPFGPFEPYANNPILTHRHRPSEPIQATGHGDLVQTAEGRWWMVLLGVRRWDGKHHHLGRETFLAPVRFNTEGWPVVNDDAPIGLHMSAEGLPPPHPWPAEAPRDELEGPRLGLVYNHVRNPRPGSWSLTERQGFLRLHGSSASLDEVSSPAFVGRRQQHHRCRASTLLQFSPAKEGERAGLTVRANESNHYDVVVTRDGGELVVQLWSRVLGTSTRIAQETIADDAIELGIEAYPDHYECFFTQRGGPARLLGRVPTEPVSTESAGGFTGVYFGMFATTSAGAEMPAADFDWFEYRPL